MNFYDKLSNIYYFYIKFNLSYLGHNVPKEKKKSDYEKRTFEIGPDDYLQEVSGHMHDSKITRLSFVTYRGKIGTYGSD